MTLLLFEEKSELFRKNLNASKPSEHPPQVEECCSECESVSAVTDSTKYGSVEGSFVSKNPTVELEQHTTVV